MIVEISLALAALLLLKGKGTTASSTPLVTSREVDAMMAGKMGAAASKAATQAAPEAARQALANGATPEQAAQAAASSAAHAAQEAANTTYTDTIHPVEVQAVIGPDGLETPASGALMPQAGDLLVIKPHNLTAAFKAPALPRPFTLETWKQAQSGDLLIRGGVSYVINKPQGLA